MVDVDVEPRHESDRSSLLVQVRLSPPAGQQWGVDGFYGIRRQARAAVTAIVAGDAEFELSHVRDDPSEVTDPDRPTTDDPVGPAT